MDALMLKNVSKAYENFQLKDISFTLPEGTIMGLIGENGAGKSTIINCIMDLVKRDSGEITVLGQQMDKDNLALREDIGIVFDVSDFYDSFSIEHTEKILQDVYKNWDHETFQRYKQQFALPDKKRMKEFSRGMKMKTAIAIALSHKPRLLILDEATSGLDPVMRDEILEVFMEFVQDEHHSILISSHISTDLEKVADYITFVHNGELVLSALKDELIYQYGIMKCREEDFERRTDMIGLIRKDLYYLASSWKPLLLSVFIIGGFSTWKGFGAILIVILPTFFGLSIMGCIQMDAQNKWYDYYRVLPISFRNVVAARYFAYLAFTGIGFLITVVYGYVIQFTMGITALGTRFAMWQGFSMGIALALSFAAVFIPATYYNKGEKMEVSMMMSGFVSFGAVYLASKLLMLLGIQLMDYADIFLQILFGASLLLFAISWTASNIIVQKRAS